MKIISWNVNGIRACHKKGLFDFLKAEDPDLFCLQETKAHKSQLEPILLSPSSDYSSYWSSAVRKGYSGTVTYSKREPILVEHGIGVEKFDSEGRFVITHFVDFVLYNVYFVNGGASSERHAFKQEFLKVFGDHLAKQVKAGKKVILVGDYNIAHKEVDIYDPVRHATTSGFLPEERQWFDGFLKSGFIDSYRLKHPDEKEKYTWWSYRELARPANRGWRIDYICTSENLKNSIQRAEILDNQEGSDHCPILLTLA